MLRRVLCHLSSAVHRTWLISDQQFAILNQFARVGGLYIWSGLALQNGRPYGLEGALGTSTNRVDRFRAADSQWSGSSVLLLLSSAPRFSKGTVPKLLSITSVSAIMYYGLAYLDKV